MIGISLESIYDDFKDLYSKEARVAFLKIHKSYDLPFDIKWDNLIEYWLKHDEADLIMGKMPDAYAEGDAHEYTEKEEEI